jgi:hypothetical protein
MKSGESHTATMAEEKNGTDDNDDHA